MAYITSYKNQNWLIPNSIKDMIPANHICFFIEEFVESLDFSGFDMIYEGPGAPAYHPGIIMKILIQGMLCKERSSRKLARACRENFVFMYLAEKVQPNFRTIARFRKNNAEFIKRTFKETVKLASKHNLIDLSLLCIDGSTIKANANRKKSVKREHIEKLDSIIKKMIEEDIKQDEIDEEIYKDKEENLTDMDKRDFKKIINDYKKAKDKDKIKEKIEKVKDEASSDEKAKKFSLTDPSSRMMQNKQKVNELSYNTQLSVSKNQIIVANDVCQDGHDVHQFVPQLKNIKENIPLQKETKIAVDCGYSDGENIKYAEENKIDLYVPSRTQAQKFDGKEESLNHDNYEYDERKKELIVKGERFQFRGTYKRKDGRVIATFYSKKLKKKKDVPFFFKERLRMKEKMESKEGVLVYLQRKTSIEPVFGNIKENFGFRQFSLRGLENVKTELNIVCIAHNLKKIWILGKEKEEKLRENMRELCNFNKKLVFINNYLIFIFNCETASAIKRLHSVGSKSRRAPKFFK